MSTPRVVLIRHEDEPDDDRVMTFFQSRGIDPEIRRPFKGEGLGGPDSCVIASVVFGGPFNVFEEERHPFLLEENRWIEDCIKRDIPLLGICQGAQSIARVLGAEVGPKTGNPEEFGYYEINPTAAGRAYFPPKLYVTQFHYHEFAIPAGAELLASSRTFRNQAFRFGRSTFAIQFHPEVTQAGYRRRQSKYGSRMLEQHDALVAQYDHAQHAWFMDFQEAFFGECVANVGKGALSRPEIVLP